MNNSGTFDLGPLTWVKGEIDQALNQASQALQEHAAILAADPAASSPALLQAARAHVHQVSGALSIIGLEGLAQFVTAIEQVLQALTSAELPCCGQTNDICQRALSLVSRYLDELLAGAPDQPLRLLPSYRELSALRGGTATAADLFYPDLNRLPPRREKEPPALAPAALTARLKAVRLGFQRGMLKWLKGEARGLTEMRNSLAMVEMSQSLPAERAFWWVAQAFLDALVSDGLKVDATVKRVCARIDAQIARLLDGKAEQDRTDASRKLLREMLYHVAVATVTTEHIECVRAAYQLAEQLLDDEAAAAAGADTDDEAHRRANAVALQALRDTLEAAKDEWSRYASGYPAALTQFQSAAGRLVAQGEGLAQVDLTRLLASIKALADMRVGQSAQEVEAPVALEVATALLLVDSALENFNRLGVDFAHQVDVMAGRLTTLLRGEALAALQTMEALPLDEISRQAQERLLRDQVVREILNNLVGVEQKLDAYFRDPAAHVAELPALALPLKQIEGALAMLGETRAVEVLRECAGKVTMFADSDLQAGQAQQDFEDVAGKLSALGFFVDKLRHGAADLDALLPQPPASQPAELPAIDLPAELPQLAELSALPDALPEFDAPLAADDLDVPVLAASQIALIEQAVVELPPLQPPVASPSAEALRLIEASSQTIDAEMLGIFLEEAHEVLAAIGEQLSVMATQPQAQEALVIVRRAFHTLKGSGRMVGLTDLGELAWSVEQVLNQWLQQARGASPALQQMLAAAYALCREWTACLAAGSPPPTADTPSVGALHQHCQRLMAGDETLAECPAAGEVATAGAAASVAIAPPEQSAEVAAPAVASAADAEGSADMLTIGELTLSPAVYDIYLTEVRGHLDVLLAEQDALRQAPPSREILRASHTLGGVSGTVGVRAVNRLGKALEYALERFADAAVVPDAQQSILFARCIAALQEMIDAFAAHRLPEDAAGLVAELEVLEALEAQSAAVPPAETEQSIPTIATTTIPEPMVATEAVAPDTPFVDQRRKLRIHDDLDPQLLPLFLEEGTDLLREIGTELRAWRALPDDSATGPRLQRLLHTLKGSARMAGAMRMGELVHGIESRLIQATRRGAAPVPAFLDDLEGHFDRALEMFDGLQRISRGETVSEDAPAATAPSAAAAQPQPVLAEAGLGPLAEFVDAGSQRAQLRVRAEMIDELINEAGEMAIARGRVEIEMRALKASLLELTDNVIRLRQQLREIEIQAESRIQAQLHLQQDAPQMFDPLEMDRFTRFQELTRMMAESVNDVTTVQHNLLRNVDNASAAIASQARLNRELSQALMGVRMLPFNAIVDRLYRVVRQVAKEVDRRVNFDIRGGQIELDRSVLEKMQASLEHLLRNAVVHGVESREQRRAAGKPEVGEIIMSLAQQGNEILIELTDDGAGLDMRRIRSKAVELGLLAADEPADDQRLAQFIFSAGFSTARQVSEVAGRGVGMDVVRTETTALGGRIEVQSTHGQGTRFRIYLPLTLAVSQALLVRSGNRSYALPSSMVEQVLELRPEAARAIREAGGKDWLDKHYPWHSLAQLLGQAAADTMPARRHWIVLLKGPDRQLALEIDGVAGNQEIVVKHIGPQLARVPGITGATVLSDGEIALILNPLVLAEQAGRQARITAALPGAAQPASADASPVIMVVDDSLTVRKIVGRLLQREGYQVVTAKDGVDALDQLQDLLPAAMLVDIEMPRMDGFELTRNVRADARLQQVPIVMITSRIADKHREHALALGVNAYLGKPYDDEELLALLRGYVAQAGSATAG
ncbi:MAG: Hpt domain-containing protein [Sterolibacterium sp.]|nr:Hpt domain-containing protein [Sterolibacterium sp.]